MSTSSIDLRYVCFEVSTPGAAFNGKAMIIYTTIKQQQQLKEVTYAILIIRTDAFDKMKIEVLLYNLRPSIIDSLQFTSCMWLTLNALIHTQDIYILASQRSTTSKQSSYL